MDKDAYVMDEISSSPFTGTCNGWLKVDCCSIGQLLKQNTQLGILALRGVHSPVSMEGLKYVL